VAGAFTIDGLGGPGWLPGAEVAPLDARRT
jgi:hypothetical protein